MLMNFSSPATDIMSVPFGRIALQEQVAWARNLLLLRKLWT